MRLVPRLLVVLPMVLWLAGVSFAEELTVANVAESYEHPTLGPSYHVQDLRFSSGHLEISMQDGSASPLIVGGKPAGLFFKGTGQFVYESVDPLEREVSMFNTSKATKLELKETEQGCQIKGSLAEVLLWTMPEHTPILEGTAGTSLREDFEKHRAIFDKDHYQPPSLVFVEPWIDNVSAAVALAQITTNSENLVHVYEPIHEQSEILYSLHKSRGRSYSMWPSVLSEQPIGRDRRDFLNPSFILSDLTYDLTVTSKTDALLSVTETIVPVSANKRVFRFYLYNDLLDTNENWRYVHVKNVFDEAGRQVSYYHRYDELIIGLPASTPNDKPFKIQFEIYGDFIVRPLGDNFWQLGTGAWYPQPPLNGRYFTVNSTVRVKKPFIALAPGDTIFRGEEDGYYVVKNKLDKPVQYTVVHAGKYWYEETVQNGVTLRVASYGAKNTRAIKQLTNLISKIIGFYEPWLGPFPFNEYNVIEIDSFGYGQAPPGTMFITSEAFNSRIGELNRIFSQGINHRIAHEVAHQYWGHVVKRGGEEETWISESFAEYSASFVVKRLKGKTGYSAMVAGWKREGRAAGEVSSIALANRIRNPSAPSMAGLKRSQLVYDKGAYLLSQLHEALGDDMFFSFLRSAQGNFAWKLTTTRQLLALLNHMTQRDYESFFDEYYWGTAMP